MANNNHISSTVIIDCDLKLEVHEILYACLVWLAVIQLYRTFDFTVLIFLAKLFQKTFGIQVNMSIKQMLFLA